MPQPETSKRPVGLALFFIIGGLIALTAAFLLTLDKIHILEDPQAQLTCNFSVLVGCSTNLGSWQGELFGFPNPLIGVIKPPMMRKIASPTGRLDVAGSSTLGLCHAPRA